MGERSSPGRRVHHVLQMQSKRGCWIWECRKVGGRGKSGHQDFPGVGKAIRKGPPSRTSRQTRARAEGARETGTAQSCCLSSSLNSAPFLTGWSWLPSLLGGLGSTANLSASRGLQIIIASEPTHRSLLARVAPHLAATTGERNRRHDECHANRRRHTLRLILLGHVAFEQKSGQKIARHGMTGRRSTARDLSEAGMLRNTVYLLAPQSVQLTSNLGSAWLASPLLGTYTTTSATRSVICIPEQHAR